MTASFPAGACFLILPFDVCCIVNFCIVDFSLIDASGDYALKVSPSTNATNLTCVSSRATPYFRITTPPTEIALDKWDGELGVWFETSWDQKAILVKR